LQKKFSQLDVKINVLLGGEINAELCLENRAESLGVKNIVVASTTGATGVKASEIFGEGYNLVVVTHVTGFRESNVQELTPENRAILERRRVKNSYGGSLLRRYRQSSAQKVWFSPNRWCNRPSSTLVRSRHESCMRNCMHGCRRRLYQNRRGCHIYRRHFKRRRHSHSFKTKQHPHVLRHENKGDYMQTATLTYP